jgi:hypothetical protein
MTNTNDFNSWRDGVPFLDSADDPEFDYWIGARQGDGSGTVPFNDADESVPTQYNVILSISGSAAYGVALAIGGGKTFGISLS